MVSQVGALLRRNVYYIDAIRTIVRQAVFIRDKKQGGGPVGPPPLLVVMVVSDYLMTILVALLP